MKERCGRRDRGDSLARARSLPCWRIPLPRGTACGTLWNVVERSGTFAAKSRPGRGMKGAGRKIRNRGHVTVGHVVQHQFAHWRKFHEMNRVEPIVTRHMTSERLQQAREKPSAQCLVSIYLSFAASLWIKSSCFFFPRSARVFFALCFLTYVFYSV